MGYGYYRYIKAISGGVQLSASDGTQLLNITESGGDVSIKNSSTTSGDESLYFANASDTYPNLRMIGAGSTIIRTPTGQGVYINEQTTQMFGFYKVAANIYGIYGGGVTGDTLTLVANTVDSAPSIDITGTGGATGKIEINATDLYLCKNDGTAFINPYWNVAYGSVIYPSIANDDLTLRMNGTGSIRFGVYTAKGAEAFDGYITIKDYAGNVRKLMTCA